MMQPADESPIVDPMQQLEMQVTDVEAKLERLKALYEQYFLGIERIEPLVPRKQVMRLFAALQQETIRNTALKFRYQSALQRWNLLQARWSKILREIELGTYSRTLARAERRGVIIPSELLPQRARTRGKAATPSPPPSTAPKEDSGFTDMLRELQEDAELTEPSPRRR